MSNDDKALRWHCRRGMRELDVLLTRYLEQHYASAKPSEQASFKVLLSLQDPEIFAYLMGRETPEDAQLVELVGKLRGQD